MGHTSGLWHGNDELILENLFLFNVAYRKKWTHAINFKCRQCHYCISDGYFWCVKSELLTAVTNHAEYFELWCLVFWWGGARSLLTLSHVFLYSGEEVHVAFSHSESCYLLFWWGGAHILLTFWVMLSCILVRRCTQPSHILSHAIFYSGEEVHVAL